MFVEIKYQKELDINAKYVTMMFAKVVLIKMRMKKKLKTKNKLKFKIIMKVEMKVEVEAVDLMI